MTAIKLDVVIFGGGAAGLWTLDTLHRAGQGVVLLETNALGTGQTVGSQGIIHGGMKYLLGTGLSKSAAAIRKMPTTWRSCLQGESTPDLSGTQARADRCYLWGNQSVGSALGMFGAKTLLQAKPVLVNGDERPQALRAIDGKVFRVDEPVIRPDSFVATLAEQHRGRVLRIAPDAPPAFDLSGGGHVYHIHVKAPNNAAGAKAMVLRPSRVVFAAGRGNAKLRRLVGLPTNNMQLRPLHMVMVSGPADRLPELNGHCVHRNRTRVTVTTETAPDGQRLWQVGGQVAEDGVRMEPPELVRHARAELAACLGDVDLSGLQWGTYRIDRAEGRTGKRMRRPSTPTVTLEGNVITAWPTKLALAPVMAEMVAKLVEKHTPSGPADPAAFKGWPTPETAKPPWHGYTQWIQDP